MEEDSLVLSNLTRNAKYYSWDFGDGHGSYRKEPVHYYDSLGRYPVKLVCESNQGCKDSLTKEVLVKVKSKFYVPTAFSPNKNNINDYFHIGTYNISTFKIIIFNRWGEIIYESYDKDFKWDGYYKGKKVPEGVYHYIVQTVDKNGDEGEKSGHVVVIH